MNGDGAICQVCGGMGQSYLSHEGKTLSRCDDCGLVFMDPMPDDATLKALYADGYEGTTRVYLTKIASKMRRSRRRARWLSRRTPGRRFLDVGCNGGFMAEAMRERGFACYGIDPDPVSVSWAREHYPGNHFHVATAETFAPEGGPFDIVYCSEVIEHCPDVNRFMASIVALMVPGGMLFLTTPDISHWRRPRDVTEWDAFVPPEHCLYFNPSNLAILMAKYGLRIVRRRLALKPTIKILARRDAKR